MAPRAVGIGLLTLALAACGGGDASGGDASPPGRASSVVTAGEDGGTFIADPIQLAGDPCDLVTQAEAEQVIGEPVTAGGPDVYTKPICTYVATGDGGLLSVELVAPEFCEFLFLALEQDLFGGDQVRVDDIGQGGMLVKGAGNVQFVVNGGCVEISASGAGLAAIDDTTMLELAKTAAERAS